MFFYEETHHFIPHKFIIIFLTKKFFFIIRELSSKSTNIGCWVFVLITRDSKQFCRANRPERKYILKAWRNEERVIG